MSSDVVSQLPKSSSVADPTFQTREARLNFPPVYAIVGIYRLATDPNLYRPIWDKVQHGTRRGLIVGFGWFFLTYRIQRVYVRYFLVNSPRFTGLSHDKIFGYDIPLDIVTYATIMFISSQFNLILKFFLSKNLRIARDRAWEQTVRSRGKAIDFWGPYVEEWQSPPRITASDQKWQQWIASGVFRIFIRKVLLAPLDLYPFIGIAISSFLKAFGTARYLHEPYFKAKKMDDHHIALFMEERKWDYRAFGFVTTFLESLPIIGLGFTVSNRIGAAMWAHDLEKRQHLYASGALLPRPS